MQLQPLFQLAKMATGDQEDVITATRYLEQYSAAIGTGLSAADIDDAFEFIQDAVPDKEYHDTADQPYAYLMLDKPGWPEKIGKLADRWAAVCCN